MTWEPWVHYHSVLPPEPVNRVGGPNGDFPCRIKTVTECRYWKCQRNGACCPEPELSLPILGAVL